MWSQYIFQLKRSSLSFIWLESKSDHLFVVEWHFVFVWHGLVISRKLKFNKWLTILGNAVYYLFVLLCFSYFFPGLFPTRLSRVTETYLKQIRLNFSTLHFDYLGIHKCHTVPYLSSLVPKYLRDIKQCKEPERLYTIFLVLYKLFRFRWNIKI